MEIPQKTLNNGVKIPLIGLGTYKLTGAEAIDAVGAALSMGCTLIDTAAAYRNEEEVGKAVRESGLPRESVFVTTKLWNDSHGFEQALKAFDNSMKKLKLDYVDLYLIHWPGKDKFVETYRALEKLYHEKLVRAIGVSNFTIRHLEMLIAATEVVPAVNQIELHPLLAQKETVGFCASKNIAVEAWSPLVRMNPKLHGNPVILRLAEKYGRTASQVILRWHIQYGVIPLPKSASIERIKQNISVFDFLFTPEEMAELNALDCNFRTGAHPDDVDWFEKSK